MPPAVRQNERDDQNDARLSDEKRRAEGDRRENGSSRFPTEHSRDDAGRREHFRQRGHERRREAWNGEIPQPGEWRHAVAHRDHRKKSSQREVRGHDEPDHRDRKPRRLSRRHDIRDQAEADSPVTVRRIVDNGSIHLRTIGESPQERIECHQVHELPVVSGIVHDQRPAEVRPLLKKRRAIGDVSRDMEEAGVISAVGAERLQHR